MFKVVLCQHASNKNQRFGLGKDANILLAYVCIFNMSNKVGQSSIHHIGVLKLETPLYKSLSQLCLHEKLQSAVSIVIDTNMNIFTPFIINIHGVDVYDVHIMHLAS